jgi:hypothetical protein
VRGVYFSTACLATAELGGGASKSPIRGSSTFELIEICDWQVAQRVLRIIEKLLCEPPYCDPVTIDQPRRLGPAFIERVQDIRLDRREVGGAKFTKDGDDVVTMLDSPTIIDGIASQSYDMPCPLIGLRICLPQPGSCGDIWAG